MNRRNDRRDSRQESKKEPVHSIRHTCNGSVLEVAVWENVVGKGKDERTVFNMSINRSYHDGDGFVDTKSFRVSDLPALAVIATEAYNWAQHEMSRT